MLRRVVISVILACLLCGGAVARPNGTAAAQPDSMAASALEFKLAEYLSALEHESRAVKCEEVDFLISSCNDSLLRQRVATRIYDHFVDSNVMGDESVAIHVFDRWFADGTVKMEDDATFYAARFHASINRPSLIGNPAPPLDLQNELGETVSLYDDAGRYRVVYFYDADCSKCLVRSVMLRNSFQKHNYPIDFYAIYVGSEGDKWKEYRQERLDVAADKMRIFHLWDPDLTSDFIQKYAVISAPKLFLIDPDGVIVGRDLDVDAMELLLEIALAPRTLEYGGDEAMGMYRSVFSPLDQLSCESVSEVAEHIEQRLLPAGDTLMYRQMIGDLLYFLSNRKEAQLKCGTEAFVDKYILERDDIWRTSDDSLKVVNLASFLKYLTSLCPLGEKLPDLNVSATVIKRNGKVRNTTVRLESASRSAIIFLTEGCPICRSEREAAEARLTRGEAAFRKLILIDMDEIWNSSLTLAEDLMGSLDLSSLPFILTTDSKARVEHKYGTFR